MSVQYRHTIVFVRDVPASRAFYESVLCQTVVEDFGKIVFFEGGLAIHDGPDLQRKAFKRDFPKEPQGKTNLEIYLESAQLDDCFERAVAAGSEIIHPIERQEWGQCVFRFFDPDGHIVEVGEPMSTESS